MNTRRLTLQQVCEPLFQYVCKLRRSAAKKCELPHEKARSDLRRLFGEMKEAVSGAPVLAAQYEKVRLPLVFFVDFMVVESSLPFRSAWVPLANELNEFAGDEKFFDLLELDLADPSDEASERLLIYYTCLGLGFSGVYSGRGDTLQGIMARIAVRLSLFLDAGQRSRLCPQAYDHTDTRDFTLPPGRRLLGIGIATVGLIIVWFVAYFLLFDWASQDVRHTIDKISPKTEQRMEASRSE